MPGTLDPLMENELLNSGQRECILKNEENVSRVKSANSAQILHKTLREGDGTLPAMNMR